jgi:hypothetical protein
MPILTLSDEERLGRVVDHHDPPSCRIGDSRLRSPDRRVQEARLGLGRNIDDVLRTRDALQHPEKSGNVRPANWEKGQDAMEPTALGVRKYLEDFGLEL